jgi:hypothetical protein
VECLSRPLTVFFDRDQSIRPQASLPPLDLLRVSLKTNCRNTRRIARSASAVGGVDMRLLPRSPLGTPPKLCRASSAAQAKGLLLSEVKKLLDKEDLQPNQIALLGMVPKQSGSLRDVEAIGETPLVTSPKVWREGGGLLVSTARSFKGLEADVIVVFDVGAIGDGFSTTDLYVACTRARGHLVVITHDDGAASVIAEAVAASEAS